MYSLTAILVAATITLAVPSAAQLGPPPSTRHNANPAAAEQEFSNRVNAYLAARKEKAGSSAHPTTSAKKITETREQMRERVQRARADAKEGDIFTRPVATYFRKKMAEAFRGPAGARVLASLRRAEPVKVALHVNQPYPEGIPLQSMPPSLLLKLPRLPKELEYRIAGRDLVLLDTAPNLVVDILRDAVPQS